MTPISLIYNQCSAYPKEELGPNVCLTDVNSGTANPSSETSGGSEIDYNLEPLDSVSTSIWHDLCGYDETSSHALSKGSSNSDSDLCLACINSPGPRILPSALAVLNRDSMKSVVGMFFWGGSSTICSDPSSETLASEKGLSDELSDDSPADEARVCLLCISACDLRS